MIDQQQLLELMEAKKILDAQKNGQRPIEQTSAGSAQIFKPKPESAAWFMNSPQPSMSTDNTSSFHDQFKSTLNTPNCGPFSQTGSAMKSNDISSAFSAMKGNEPEDPNSIFANSSFMPHSNNFEKSHSVFGDRLPSESNPQVTPFQKVSSSAPQASYLPRLEKSAPRSNGIDGMLQSFNSMSLGNSGSAASEWNNSGSQ